MNRVLRNRVAELVAIKSRQEKRTIYKTTLAAETGLSKRTVDKWMANDVTLFDDNTLMTWADYFGVGIGELFIIEDTESPETQTYPTTGTLIPQLVG